MKNTVVHIVNELRCHFLAITLLCKLMPLSWRNARVIRRIRRQCLEGEVKKRRLRFKLPLLCITPVLRLLPFQLFYFFQLLPNYKLVKDTIRLPQHYRPSSQLEPEKLNSLYHELMTIPEISQSSGMLITQPALKLEEAIVGKLFCETLGVCLEKYFLKLFSVIERPSVAMFVFLRLCGCPNCQLVMSADRVIELMGHHVTNRIYSANKKIWIDVEGVFEEDLENKLVVNKEIRNTTETIRTISSVRERYDAQLVKINMYLQGQGLLRKDHRVFKYPMIYDLAVKKLLENTTKYKL